MMKMSFRLQSSNTKGVKPWCVHRTQSGSIDFEDLVITNVLLILAGLVLIYCSVWIMFQKVINAANMIHVPMRKDS
jgi:hypothetical protein